MPDLPESVQNTALCDSTQQKNVTVTTDGAKELLDVLAVIDPESAFNLQAFNPLSDYDTTGVVTNVTTWDTIFEVTSTRGKLEFVACVAGTSNYEVRITIDTVEFITISMADLSTLGLSNATNVEMWVETAGKNFRYSPKEPVDFKLSCKVEVRATSATPTVQHIILYKVEAA